MAEESGDVKPAQQTINLKVVEGDNQMTFKVKRSTKFEKIFQAFCQRKGGNPDTFRFTYDGDRIQKDKTPEDYNMEDGDQIDVAPEQTGGARQY